MEREIMKRMEKAGKMMARLELLNQRKDVFKFILDEKTYSKLEDLLEIYAEMDEKKRNTETTKEKEEFIKFLESCDMTSIEIELDFILQKLISKKKDLEKEVRNEMSVDEKIKNALKQGRKMFEKSGFSKHDDLEAKIKKDNPIAHMTMEIIQHMAREFIKELKKRGAKVNVPVTEDGKLLEGISVKYGEDGVKEITLEEILKSVAEFVPMVITAELHMDLKRSGRVEEFVKGADKNV